jgi:hypothetical protein
LLGTRVSEVSGGGEGGTAQLRETGLLGTRVSEVGEVTQEVRKAEATEFDYPLRDFEAAYAAKHDIMYPLTRTLTNFVPFLSLAIWPSAQDAFERKSAGGQTLELGLEAMGLIPPLVIGKGLKIAAKGVESVLGLAAKPVWKILPKTLRPLPDAAVMANPFADGLMADVVRYQHKTVAERLMGKYSLEADEAAAVIEGRTTVWRPGGGPSGAWVPEKTEKLAALHTKDNVLRQSVLDDIHSWIKPQEWQELNHYIEQSNRLFYKITAGTNYKNTDVLRTAATRIYGEAGKDMRFDNITLDTLGQVMNDVLQHGAGYRRAMDISRLAYWRPDRKVFGVMDLPWGTSRGFFEPVKELFKTKNIAETEYVRRWQGMLAAREFEGKPLLKMTTNKLGQVKLTENYTRKEFANAGKLATDIDLAQSSGKTMAEVQAIMSAAPLKEQAIAKTMWDWHDSMYASYIQRKVLQLFEGVGLTTEGRKAITGIMSRTGGPLELINNALKPGNNLNYVTKLQTIHQNLESFKSLVSEENIHWFSTKALKDLSKDELKELMPRLNELKAKLTLRTDKNPDPNGFTGYLENYTARIPKGTVKPWTAENGLPSDMHAAFTNPRALEELGFEIKTDIPSIIGTRARAQSNELYLYPHIDDYKGFVSKLPPMLKEYSTHWLNRQLGISSPADVSTAKFLNRFSLNGWDARRVDNVARTITDLMYLGGIGFKPFSAMRNYIQFVLMTPAELGGIKDIAWLAPGIKKAVFEPAHREYLRSIGAIAEYTPDITFNLRVSNYQASFLEKARDFGMWMFKASDYHVRLMTGGAAVAKWDYYFARLGKDGIIPNNKLDAFRSKLGFGMREPVIRNELDNFVRIGTPEAYLEAKKVFVKDVIADSQYLYGKEESPLINYKSGAFGKTTLVFQSWWMNYADTLGKWLLRTPEVPGKAISATNERLFSFMLSSALAFEIGQPIWGTKRSATSVMTGPLPLSLSIPPAWKPVFDSLRVVADTAALVTPWGDLEQTKNQMTQLIKDSAIFVPGGIQAYLSYQGARKEGLPGVLKSIIGYRSPKKEEESK